MIRALLSNFFILLLYFNNLVSLIVINIVPHADLSDNIILIITVVTLDVLFRPLLLTTFSYLAPLTTYHLIN